MISLLIVARIPLLREGFRALLSGERDFRVSTLDPTKTLTESVLETRPDVVLVDVDVLEHDGWGLLADWRDLLPAMATLVISDNPTDRRFSRALALGAQGYLVRDATGEQMAAAIRAAHEGLVVVHPAAANLIWPPPAVGVPSEEEAALTGEGSEAEDRAVDLVEPISPRELDVLRLIARGMSNKQIAAQLFITEHTVKFHIRAILGKLGAANRTEAVTVALQKGLVTL